MPLIQPDLSEVVALKPMEPGAYPAKIMEVVAKTSSNNNPMLEITFEVDYEGKKFKRKDWIVISGQAAYKFGNLLRATGFEELAAQLADPSVQPKPGFDTDSLVGQELMVNTDQETRDGELRDKIKSYMKK